MRPYFDQERHKKYVTSHESFHGSSLCEGGSLGDVLTENVVGLSDQVNRGRGEISTAFRVLCLCKNFHSPAMWGYYADSFRGVVVGIDVTEPSFAKGLRPDGFPVEYTIDRSKTKLPLAYYQFPWVENTVKNLNEEVVSNGGLFIPFRTYREQVESAFIACLTTKAPCWRYEREVRFIYDLRQQRAQLRESKGFHAVQLQPPSIKEIMVGFGASPRLVAQIARSAKSGVLRKATVFTTWCHPHRYKVLRHSTSPDELHWRYTGKV